MTVTSSRLILVVVLATGLLSGAESAGAISGASLSENAAAAQYPLSMTPGGALGEQEASGRGSDEQEAVQPATQLSAADGDGGSLPFTGMVAVPLLVVGAGMLAAGVALRRRAPAGAGRRRG